jgi:hypothetical protein
VWSLARGAGYAGTPLADCTAAALAGPQALLPCCQDLCGTLRKAVKALARLGQAADLSECSLVLLLLLLLLAWHWEGGKVGVETVGGERESCCCCCTPRQQTWRTDCLLYRRPRTAAGVLALSMWATGSPLGRPWHHHRCGKLSAGRDS